MGNDIRDVDLVVHCACPTSVVSYWQEAGRCARVGRQGMSFIFYDNFTASLKATDVNIAAIVRNSEIQCIRQNIMDVFADAGKETFTNKTYSGCNAAMCTCESCKCCSYCASTCPSFRKDSLVNLFMMS